MISIYLENNFFRVENNYAYQDVQNTLICIINEIQKETVVSEGIALCIKLKQTAATFLTRLRIDVK